MPRPTSSAWPSRVLWQRGRRGAALGMALVTLLTLLVWGVCMARLVGRGVPTPSDGVLFAAALLLGPWLVWRLQTWAVTPEQAPAWWRPFTRNAVGMAGCYGVLLLFFMAALAPLLAPQDPSAFDDMTMTRFQAPGGTFLLGSDQFGRDVLTRMLHGARISLGVACMSVLLTMVLGTVIGLVAGYRGGWVDAALMRLVDLLLAFPRIFLVLLVISLAEPSLWLVVSVLAVTGWMATARLVRGEVLSIRERDYVQAARALGIPTWRIVLRHVLPNAVAPIVVSATLMIGNVILAESVLSFLGLGVPVPTPSWGAMVDEGRAVFPDVWWLATFPGLAITMTVVAFNLLGDGLRDALDPRTQD